MGTCCRPQQLLDSGGGSSCSSRGSSSGSLRTIRTASGGGSSRGRMERGRGKRRHGWGQGACHCRLDRMSSMTAQLQAGPGGGLKSRPRRRSRRLPQRHHQKDHTWHAHAGSVRLVRLRHQRTRRPAACPLVTLTTGQRSRRCTASGTGASAGEATWGSSKAALAARWPQRGMREAAYHRSNSVWRTLPPSLCAAPIRHFGRAHHVRTGRTYAHTRASGLTTTSPRTIVQTAHISWCDSTISIRFRK